MDFLHNTFVAAYKNTLTIGLFTTKLIAYQLQAQGIVLTRDQLDQIEARLKSLELDEYETHINDIIVEAGVEDKFEISFDSIDDVDHIVDNISEKLPNLYHFLLIEQLILCFLHYNKVRKKC